MPDDQALARLRAVKHIVVLMMENRSFDHMLGYLKTDGMPEVNGLNGDEFNLAPDGTKVAIGGGLGPFALLKGAPIYDVPAFTRQLHDKQWRWYSHDPATLRAVDGHYRDLLDIKRDNFTYYDRKRVSLITQLTEGPIVARDSFLDDAAKGELRDVSWIDPNFIDLNVLDPNSNDDHPPSDIRAGQAFVLELYEALRRSPNWNDTVLVIVYDEHGGFYDHQSPPTVSDDTDYATLGVRVPALVVGPRVKQEVSHQVFQHT